VTWDEILDRLTEADLKPAEEIYMEHYGKVLAAQRKEFRDRYFRVTYGALHCKGLRIEVYLFPSEIHLQEFLEVIGDDPWYVATGNIVLHFPECDPALIDNIVATLATAPR